ncbi:uncharacterized protein BDZ99DRAFT_576986 [Mytilinidion resinicola]|uniref:DUF6604 domain-containing protein n=1 Tax=Mytilinidion resinicola TaxID=574789 RepID=A0A6A6Y0W6_9PEZI|nr:uncharacterized protein BDZ99DRAFT_576986 [Mytilinidion resinicola]KAF2802290.1 hypothetical protein BDZ99DRAFT_576986 [Mytilinidion resinicola]
MSPKETYGELYCVVSSGLGNSTKNLSHVYFTSVLERVRDDLHNHQKHISADSTSIEDVPTIPEPDKSLAILPGQTSVTHMDELVELDDVHPDTASAVAAEEEMTVDLDSERQFVIDLFLDDLMEVRVYLRGIWAMYTERRITVVTASLVTNFAIDILKKAVVDLHEDMSQLIVPPIIDCWSQLCKEAGVSVDLSPPEKSAQLPSLLVAADRMYIQVLVHHPNAFLVPTLLKEMGRLGEHRPDASFLLEDQLTEWLSVSTASDVKEEWNHFALQILIDIHDVLKMSIEDPFADPTTVMENTLTSIEDFTYRDNVLGVWKHTEPTLKSSWD